MKVMVLETTHKRTGGVFFVIESPRGRYFGLVPKSHPAQKPIRFARCKFTAPEWKEVA